MDAKQPKDGTFEAHEEGLKLYKASILSGKLQSMVLPITPAQYLGWLRNDKLIQDAFPQLSADQREFMLSGSTPEEWDQAFGEDEEGG